MKKSILVIIAMVAVLSGCVTSNDTAQIGVFESFKTISDDIKNTNYSPYSKTPPKFIGFEARGKWAIDSHQHDFDEYYQIFATTKGRNDRTKITIWCVGAVEQEVYIGWDEVLRGDYVAIRVRFDNEPPYFIKTNSVFGKLDTNTAIKFENAKTDFIKKLVMHEKLIMNIAGEGTVRFDLTGAKEALAPLSEYCEWGL